MLSLEGKSMTPCRETLFSSVPPSNSAVSVSCVASGTTEKQGHRQDSRRTTDANLDFAFVENALLWAHLAPYPFATPLMLSILVKPSDAELEDQLSERLANPLPEPKLPAAHWLDTPETRDRQLKIGEEVARVVADINFLKAGLFLNTLLYFLGQSKD